MSLEGLRKAFPPELVGKLPATAKRPQLDYVGHAAVTDRLNQEAPGWSYHLDPVEVRGRIVSDSDGRRFVSDPDGLPHVVAVFGTITIDGVTREEVGEVDDFTTYGDEMKKAISDFIRRGAMRFGVALDLWSKEDLTASGASPLSESLPNQRSSQQTAAPEDVPPSGPVQGEGAANPPGGTTGEGDLQGAPSPTISDTSLPVTADDLADAAKHGLTPTKAKAIAASLGITVTKATELTREQLASVINRYLEVKK